ncbi:hypothetical protein V6N13_075618 [Hibiscus sabdariffa]|uniref:RNase H type-1 domain-containing protein n=1 Tax=Hibiscus sabdariffa TaxID=183260 RepID=A0ABR2UCM4_9ROSI
MQVALEAHLRGGNIKGAATIAGWKLPSEGWFKVNTDGARNSSTDMTYREGALQDDEGYWRSVRNVILKVDSVDVVLAINKRRKGYTRLRILTQVLALVADELVKVARFDSLNCDVFETPPAGINHLLRLDGFGG